MPLYAPETQGREFELPAEGVTRAVCADVIDRGILPGFENKPTHKITLVFQIDQEGSDGKPLQVQQWFSLSMNEKANLRRFLEAWRGKRFEVGEAGKFDLTGLVGKSGLVTLVHGRPNAQGKVYANISTISPLMKGMESLPVRDYIRYEKPATNGAASTDSTPEFMKPKPGDAF